MSGGAGRDTISYIEDCIAQLRPINLSLRLVGCLWMSYKCWKIGWFVYLSHDITQIVFVEIDSVKWMLFTDRLLFCMFKVLNCFFSQVCLLSHCGDGLTLSDYQRLKTQFVQAYGFQHLVTWNNLLKVSRSEIKMKDIISTGGIGQGEGWTRWWSNTGQVSSTKSSLAITPDPFLWSIVSNN